MIHARPELAQLHQGFGSVLEQVKLIDAVAETEDKSPGDDCGNERCENLCGDGRCPLQAVLVPLRRALARLIEQGYIQAGQGRRMRVIYQPTEQNEFMIGGIESFREAAARNHFQAVTRVIHFAEDVVDEKTSQKTGLPLGSDIYDVRRIRYLDGKALILDINLFLREAVPDLTPEIASRSIYGYIENDLGMVIVTSRRRMTVEYAVDLDMHWLEMGDYNCLAVVSGRTYNAEGIQFEYTQSRHHPEYFCFEDTAVRRRSR